MSNLILDPKVITYVIKNEFVKNECNVIGNLKKWDKNYNGIGQKFNKLTITKQYKVRGKKKIDCQCECGGTLTTFLYQVKYGHIKSCGCVNRNALLQQAIKSRGEYGKSSFSAIYCAYRANARNARNGSREFTLTKEDAKKFFLSNCFYCGRSPSKIKIIPRGYGEFVYNGIDRKDNMKGYTLDNCVSCCEFCNLTKNDTQFDEFIKWIRIVYEHTKHI